MSLQSLRVTPREWSVASVQQWLLVQLSVSVVTLSGWLLVQPRADGYETIYGAYPVVFWLVLSAGICATIVVCVLSAMRGDRYWRLALTLGSVLYLLYNVVPLARGWAMYGRGGADVLAHVGYTKAILRTGQPGTWDFYPGFHVLLAEFRLAGFEFRAVDALFSGLFYVIYLLGVFLLVRELAGRRDVALASLAFALVPLYDKFHHTFHPAVFSFMLVPLLLYVFVRYRNTEARSYLHFGGVLATALVVSHPVTTLYLLVMLVVTMGATAVANRAAEAGRSPWAGVSLVAYTGLGWVVWYGQFAAIRERLLIAVGVDGGQGATVAQTYGSQRVATAPSLLQVVVPALERYGPVVFVGAVAAVGLLAALRRARAGVVVSPEIWLSGQYTTGLVLSVFSTVTFTAALTYNPIRNGRLAILVATMFAGVVLMRRLLAVAGGGPGRRRLQAGVVVVLLVLAVPVAVTHSFYPHMHLTHTEEDGTEWFYDHYEPESNAVSHGVSSKMRSYTQGEQYSRSVFSDIGGDSPVPRYLGYRTNDTLAETVGGERTYLVTKSYDTAHVRSLKPYLRESNTVYNDRSLGRLGNDTTADRVYANGGYTVWFANGTRVPPDE